MLKISEDVLIYVYLCVLLFFEVPPFTGTRLVGLVVCFLRIWHFARSLLRGPVESETSPQPLSVTPKLLVIK